MHRVFFQASEWIYNMMKLNGLWLLGIVAGLGLLGVMPATTAVAAVTRKWAHGNQDVPMWNLFWKTYKQSFATSNQVGALFAVLALILLANLRISVIVPGTVMMVAHYFILFILFALLASAWLFFFIYVHYELPTKVYLFQSVAMVFSKPISMLMLAAGIGAAVWMMAHMPGLLPFFAIVWPSYWSSVVCKKMFSKMEQQTLAA
ncbi:YesL family protein [Shouchella clausii]|uniref:YesL family protein n=1 Tax=Shouchella clausii TaxID=79880 RepID=UPI000BA7C25D|nr:YesL family protein [Shouchella clausii]PAD16224.1 hypothetical protein CHH73_13460 [Shouchella clausii]